MEHAPLVLSLRTPFRIAHGTSTSRTNVLVRLEDGLGEGAMPPYYPHTYDDVAAYLDALDDDLLHGDPLALHTTLDRLPSGPAPAHAALDIALHDRWGRAHGRPLYQLWGLSPERLPQSAVTLSMPEDDASYRDELARYADEPILKLKLGSGDLNRDLYLVHMARDASAAQLCVDANSGWSVDEAAQMVRALHKIGVLFVEQPIASTEVADWQMLREKVPPDAPPLIADESVQGTDDILRLANVVDGINIKLTKAGGLRGAHQQILLARTLGLRVLLGCMIESAVAVTAAAHLAPLVDYADLDASLHLSDDPFVGVRLEHGRIVLPDGPGLGVTERS